MQNESATPKIRVKAYSSKEVAGLYGISGKTLQKWLAPFGKEIGQRNGHFYNPKQVKIIFERLGIPEEIYLI